VDAAASQVPAVVKPKPVNTVNRSQSIENFSPEVRIISLRDY
jgi:hypothetical protein